MNVRTLLHALMITTMIWGAGAAAEESSTAAAAPQAVETVDINTADAATLERVLDGVGRSRAEAIVAYREANGRFLSAEELTAVKGIGPSTVERNADRIRVE